MSSASVAAPILSPALTGTPTAPTPTAGDSSTKIATTAVRRLRRLPRAPAGVATFNGRSGTVLLQLTDVTSVGGAPIASPSFTGAPLAPTVTAGDNSTKIATTGFVQAALPIASSAAPIIDGSASAGSATAWSRGDHVHPTDTTRYAASNPAGYQTAAQVNAVAANYLPLAGGTVAGNFTAQGGTILAQTSSTQASMAMVITGVAGAGTAHNAGGFIALCETDGSGTPISNLWMANYAGGFVQSSYGTAYKPGGGPWQDTSDARIKTVDGDYTHGLAELLALRPVVYRYKGNDSFVEKEASSHARAAGETNFIGLVAQEAETVLPECVTQREGWIDGVKIDDLRTTRFNAADLRPRQCG